MDRRRWLDRAGTVAGAMVLTGALVPSPSPSPSASAVSGGSAVDDRYAAVARIQVGDLRFCGGVLVSPA